MPNALPRFSVSYGGLLAAAIATYRIPPKGVAAFRGRLGSLQRGGLLGRSPGKGKALRYTPDLIHRVVCALELAEFGVAPSVILSLVKTLWDRKLRKIFDEADDTNFVMHNDAGPVDVCLFICGPRLLGDAMGVDAVPNVNACKLGALPGNISMVMADPTSRKGLPPRVAAVNVTSRLRSFHRELAEVWLQYEN